MIVLVVVDPKLIGIWLIPFLQGVRKALQAAPTVLKRLVDS